MYREEKSQEDKIMNKQSAIGYTAGRIQQYSNGLITLKELEQALDKIKIRGGFEPDTRLWIGYDYDNQDWIQIQA